MAEEKRSGIESFIELAFVIGAFLWSSFVLMKLWNWHAVSVLGLPMIGYAQAIGLDCIFGAFSYRYVQQKAKWEERVGESITYFALLLFVGWVVK